MGLVLAIVAALILYPVVLAIIGGVAGLFMAFFGLVWDITTALFGAVAKPSGAPKAELPLK